MPLKWIPRSKPGASKSRPRWAAHTRIGNVWEYPPPPRVMHLYITLKVHSGGKGIQISFTVAICVNDVFMR